MTEDRREALRRRWNMRFGNTMPVDAALSAGWGRVEIRDALEPRIGENPSATAEDLEAQADELAEILAELKR